MRSYNAVYNNQSYNMSAYAGQSKSYTMVFPGTMLYLGTLSVSCSGVIGIMVKLDSMTPTAPTSLTQTIWVQNVTNGTKSGNNLVVGICVLVVHLDW